MAVTTFHSPVAAATDADFSSRIDALRARWARWRLYRRTIRELSELNDLDLADIGMSRAGIRSVAWHAVYG
ncbi:DUF1127 domain-containing protein [Rhodovulum sp. DZ06]|uniref:DUF1127 domain-containing protein n=1 Tax=Rhodovulum sp. DZ06 TaxID=3425126 RepID=UPI003D3303DE